ncbi:hypothetical protein XAC29_12260 [Xanthomonas axonopodis Xac29-1]|nr:hypothetical protein XAC29_12260 [Xanthomonas axonopodis Xac29-1]AYL21140.1 hypothetical protein COR42_12830 [Xanthomonas citri pv. citri]
MTQVPKPKLAADQLSTKRTVLFWLLFSVVGLVYGWPFAAPSVLSILQYRTTSALFTATMLVCAMAVDGHLWMLRNPGKTQADYYRRKHWWLHALDWEFRSGKAKREGQQ